jgi:TetR/AcrR family acrAB operon transcriptional repressor
MSKSADPPHASGGKRARTRAKLVEAAAALIMEKGYERTSLEDVAMRAGMTRGAIYGNFRNKEDLFLAVVAARWEPVLPPFKPGAGFAQQMDVLARALIAVMPARRAAALGAASFQTYALTHDAMRQRISAANAEIYRHAAAALRAHVPENQLPMPADRFVRVMHALMDGLMFLHALTPELVGEAEILAAFRALGGPGSASASRA